MVHHRAPGAGDGDGDPREAGGQRARRDEIADRRRERVALRLVVPGDVHVGDKAVVLRGTTPRTPEG